MSALEPVFLWLGLLALPLILLYTVRRRRPEVGVPSLILWRDVVAGPAQRRKLLGVLDRRLLGLALLLLVLASLVLGLARVAGQRLPARDVVAIVDVSGVMDAPGRLPAAHRGLDALARGLGPDDRLWVVTAGREARVVWGPEPAPPPAGWAALAPAEGAGADVPGALRLAGVLLAGSPERRREVWGWSATPVTAEQAPAGALLRWAVPPPPARDLAVRGRLRSLDEERLELSATVANLTSRAASARAVLRVDGRDVVRLPALELPPGARRALAPQVLERARAGQRVTLRLVPDDLPHDDVLEWLVPPRPRLRVAQRGDDRFVRAALASDPGLDVVGADAGPAVEVSTVAASPGGRLLLGPAALPEGSGLVANGEAPALGTPRATRHPLLRGVELEGLLARRVTRFEPAPGADWRPIAWVGATPLLWVRDGATRSAFLAVAPAETDLVLRRGFPILVANAVRWLARDTPADPRWVLAGRQLPGAGRHPDPALRVPPAPAHDWPGAPPVRPPANPRPLWAVLAFGLLLLEAVLFLRGRTT